MLDKFDGDYKGFPAARFSNVTDYNTFRLLLIRAGYSFKTAIIPAKKNRRAREIIIMLLHTIPPEVSNGT
tara:strand:- start:3524 stop:3733 length:210 start_codon:yes stop_codon:yes gene_type:complete